jgi:hypothetical protein
VLTVCGTNCDVCPHLNIECKGTCESQHGQVYWTKYTGVDVCPVYKCAQDQQFENCGDCQKLSCELWFSLKDPGLTAAEHQKSINERVKALRQIIAPCGYRCDLCPAFSGNIHGEEDRQKVSDGWFKYFGFRVAPEQINCDGCAGNNETLDKECPVRPCAKQKNLPNCGSCQDLPCEKLQTRLNPPEKWLGDLAKIPHEEYATFLKPYLGRDRLKKIHAQPKK